MVSVYYVIRLLTFQILTCNFKLVGLSDSYSDNKELAITTENLERVVIKIIDDEEKKRSL